MSELSTSLQQALGRRSPLFQQFQHENTDSYRLFHGSSEGHPGLTIDRYGPQLLIQSFHHSLDESTQQEISENMQRHFVAEEVVYQDRSQKKQTPPNQNAGSSAHHARWNSACGVLDCSRQRLADLEIQCGIIQNQCPQTAEQCDVDPRQSIAVFAQQWQ